MQWVKVERKVGNDRFVINYLTIVICYRTIIVCLKNLVEKKILSRWLKVSNLSNLWCVWKSFNTKIYDHSQSTILIVLCRRFRNILKKLKNGTAKRSLVYIRAIFLSEQNNLLTFLAFLEAYTSGALCGSLGSSMASSQKTIIS